MPSVPKTTDTRDTDTQTSAYAVCGYGIIFDQRIRDTSKNRRWKIIFPVRPNLNFVPLFNILLCNKLIFVLNS